MPRVDENLMSAFRLAVEDILHFLRTRGESGSKNMFTNPHSTGGNNVRPWGVYPGFTDTVLFP